MAGGVSRLWRRVVEEAGMYAARVASGKPPAQRVLYAFRGADDLVPWRAFSDRELGGSSSAALVATEAGAALQGDLKTELRVPGGALRRGGYCGMRTEGEPPLDLEPYEALELRVRSDGRKYIVNVRTETWSALPGEAEAGDLWQSFLFAPAGEWADVRLPFSRFLKTYRGRVVETESDMNTRTVLSLGLSLAGGGVLEPSGPYRLEIERIRAT